MAFKFRRIKKVFGFDKSKTEKYVVVPDRATPVSFRNLCEQIALISGINLGNVQATLFALVRSMKTFFQEGHAVQVEGFGTFMPSFNAKSSQIEEDANADSIVRVKLRFIPCDELRTMLNNITFTFNEKDSTNDSKTSTSTEEDEQPDEL